MKKAVKAAILSGLICPGLGHFVVKRYLRGIVLLTIALVSTVIVGYHTIHVGLLIINNITQGDLSLDPQEISDLLSGATSRMQYILLNLARLGLIGSWVFSMFDSYRLGRQEDKKTAEPAILL